MRHLGETLSGWRRYLKEDSFMRAVLALAVAIFLASLAVGAQGGGGGTQQPPPAAPTQQPAAPAPPPAAPAPPPVPPGTPTKALVPIAASTFASNPDAYVGEFVSLTG